MKRKYARLTQTGSRCPSSKVDQLIQKIMSDEVDTVGDTVGSSASGIEVRGNN